MKVFVCLRALCAAPAGGLRQNCAGAQLERAEADVLRYHELRADHAGVV